MAMGEKRIIPWSVNGVEADGTGDIALGTGQVLGLDAALQAKADKTAVDAALQTKADKTAVDAALQTKADKTAVETALSHKVNERGYLTTEQFNATDYNFPYTASISSAVTGAPEPGYYNVLYLPLKNTPGYGTQVISNVNVPGRLFLRQSITNGMWEPWIPIATATPPQEYRLPLAAGWAESTVSTYFRNQFHEVTINFKVFLSAGSSSGLAVGLHTIAALPVGYRPSNPVYFVCAAADWTGAFFAGWVLENGAVNVSVPVAIPPKQLVGFAGSVSFAAG